MELLDGELLMDRLVRFKRFDEETTLRYTRSIAGVLEAAHARDIVHRDLKPDNVFVVPAAELPGGVLLKLLDFGVAKIGEAAHVPASKTGTGSVLGTPTYMSPEQCRAAGFVDHRSDLYSLGCMMYEMLSGRPPFIGVGAGELIAQHQLGDVTPLGQVAPHVSSRTQHVVMTPLEKRPERRFQSASDLLRTIGIETWSGSVGTSEVSPSGERSPSISPQQRRARVRARNALLSRFVRRQRSITPTGRSRRSHAVV
jgi:serine/threonine-protein kinase